MTIVMCIIIALSAILFAMDKKGKIDNDGIGRALAYIGIPLLIALVITIGSAVISPKIDADAFEYSLSSQAMSEGWELLKQFLIVSLLAVPSIVISVIGCGGAVKREYGIENDIFGGSAVIGVKRLGKSAKTAACVASFAAIISLTATVVALVSVFGVLTEKVLFIIMAAIVAGMLTFGIGFVIMLVVAPFYLLSVGAAALTAAAPLVIAAIVWGCAFVIIHIMAVIFGISAVKLMNKNEMLDKASAIKNGLMTAIPIVNIFALHKIIKNMAL